MQSMNNKNNNPFDNLDSVFYKITYLHTKSLYSNHSVYVQQFAPLCSREAGTVVIQNMNNKINNHCDNLDSAFYKITYLHTEINAYIVLFIYPLFNKAISVSGYLELNS